MTIRCPRFEPGKGSGLYDDLADGQAWVELPNIG